MAIKNILVGWTGLPGAEDALHVAALMARKHDAHLTGLLVHRAVRDDVRCRSKYGKWWGAYCELVPYKLVPYVW